MRTKVLLTQLSNSHQFRCITRNSLMLSSIRISIETLDGKVVAVDASIWITQFVKVLYEVASLLTADVLRFSHESNLIVTTDQAMRDDEGNMVKNAHLIGTMKRILKLLFHRIRPVFVFDGATPLLKMQTVKIRRNIREKQVSSAALLAVALQNFLHSLPLHRHQMSLSPDIRYSCDAFLMNY